MLNNIGGGRPHMNKQPIVKNKDEVRDLGQYASTTAADVNGPRHVRCQACDYTAEGRRIDLALRT